MKKMILILFVLLIPSCSNDTVNSANNAEELLVQLEAQNGFTELTDNPTYDNYDYHFDEGKLDLEYDIKVKEENKLMVTLQDISLCQFTNIDYHFNLVLEGSLLKVLETANANHDGKIIKWYRVLSPQYDNVEGWISEAYIKPFDSNDSVEIVNVKCIGPVTVYLDDNNELGAKSTRITTFQGIIVAEKDKFIKIALTPGTQFWVNKYDIRLHFEELMN